MAQYTAEDGILKEPDVCAAMVAVQLGLIDEAEKLYAGCGRCDDLNELPLPLHPPLPLPLGLAPSPTPTPN